MENFLIIGEIVKPQGIKGEVKLIPYSEDQVQLEHRVPCRVVAIPFQIGIVRMTVP